MALTRAPRRVKRRAGLLLLGLAGMIPAGMNLQAAEPGAATLPPPAAQQLAHDVYRELLEINTTDSEGDTYRAAQAMAARLRAGGLPDADIQVFRTAERRGNLVARLRGSGRRRPLLLMAHLDVVEARREDWSTDPFKLVEKDGWYYARGSVDDKYMAAVLVADLIRLQQEHFKPDRDLILLLETDEEISDAHGYGIRWMLEHHRDLIDAGFALNEGGSVGFKDGRALWNGVQTSEKLYQSFWLEADNPGGHSSQPRRDNAIYALAAALGRLEKYEFPVQLNDTTRLFFERMAGIESGQLAADMRSVTAQPDPAAVARLSMAPNYNAQLRTTCVATRLEGGHADNALPQRARALVNCRILPGGSREGVRATLQQVIGDAIRITPIEEVGDSPASPLDPELMTAVETLTRQFWPGAAVLPVMSAGATDGRVLRAAGIPAYGHSGLLQNIADVRTHGRDERVSVRAFYRGEEYLYRLIKALAD
jgi:acetylornithine deacetylase/succinyl-diaminopimelate desuccinylase-like protein